MYKMMIQNITHYVVKEECVCIFLYAFD